MMTTTMMTTMLARPRERASYAETRQRESAFSERSWKSSRRCRLRHRKISPISPHLSPIRRAGDKKEARKVYDKQSFFRVFPRILYRAAAICACSAVSPPFSFFFLASSLVLEQISISGSLNFEINLDYTPVHRSLFLHPRILNDDAGRARRLLLGLRNWKLAFISPPAGRVTIECTHRDTPDSGWRLGVPVTYLIRSLKRGTWKRIRSPARASLSQ